jgi:hypothetical protein
MPASPVQLRGEGPSAIAYSISGCAYSDFPASLLGTASLLRGPELVFGRSGRFAGTPAGRKVLLQLPSGLPGWVLGW